MHPVYQNVKFKTQFKKMIMKKILALSLAFTVITLSVSAQEKNSVSPTGKMDHKHKHGSSMMKDVNLSEAQKTQLKTLREDKSLSEADRKAKMNTILTPDQKEKMARNKSERKAMHEQRQKDMQSKVGLNNDQMSKMKALNEANRAKMKAIKENSALSKEEKRQQMKTLKESSQDQRKNILTADQLKKMEALKKEHKGEKRRTSRK